MPDLSNLLTPPPPQPPSLPLLRPCDASVVSAASSSLPKTLQEGDTDPSPSSFSAALGGRLSRRLRSAISTQGTCSVIKKERKKGSEVKGKSLLEEHVSVWRESRVAQGFEERDSYLPFLTKNAPKMVACRSCDKEVYPSEAARCSVRGCQDIYHRACLKQLNGNSSSKGFTCSQHACLICKKTAHWRCVLCTMASHTKCSPWPEKVILLSNAPKQAICWRHPTDWRLDKELPAPTVHEFLASL